jgi:hypothetical protein
VDLKRIFADSLAIFRKNALALIVGGVILCVVAVACVSGPAFLLGISLELNDNGQPDLGSLGGQLLWVFAVTAALVVCIVMPLSYGLLNVSLRFATGGEVGGPAGVFSGLHRWGAIALFVVIKAVLYSVIAVGLAIPLGILTAVLAAMMGWFGLILGYLLFLAPFVYFELIWLYVPAFLYDKEVGLLDALRESRRLATRHGLLTTFVCIVIPAGIALGVALIGAFFFRALGLDPQVVGIGGQVIEYAVFTPWLFAVIVVMYMLADDRGADLEAALAGRPAGSRPMPYGMLPMGPKSATPFPSANPFPSASPRTGSGGAPTPPQAPLQAPQTPPQDAPPAP